MNVLVGAEQTARLMDTNNPENIENIRRKQMKVNYRERALKGQLFDARVKELVDIKYVAHNLCREYNSLDEKNPRRDEIIKELLGTCGEKVGFMGPIQFNYGVNTHIGDNFFANFNLTVLDDGPIYIGTNVMIGPNVSLMASSHPLIPIERESWEYPDGHRGMSEYAPPITIEDHVWIACGTIVTGGVTIGEGAVIGAGSVVTRDIPAGWFACGVPCKPVRKITDKDKYVDMV